MYVCKEHGQLETEWCGECEKIVFCDCKDQTHTRFKDMTYDCEDGERTFTMYLHHCATCGMGRHVEI